MKFYKLLFSFLCCAIVFISNAQKRATADSLGSNSYEKFKAEQLIIPGVTIGYGLLALHNPTLLKINHKLNRDIASDKPFKADDALMFVPAASIFAFDLFGHKAKHSFKDRSFILLTSAVIANGSAFALKSLTNERRPNEDKYNSFPSGHTTNAFMGAEMMRIEYKDASAWYAIFGYAMAFTTGYLRMYNNKHWFSDVVAGAGLGILSTNVAYWIYPWMQRTFSCHKNSNLKAMVLPTYNGKNTQIGMVFQF